MGEINKAKSIIKKNIIMKKDLRIKEFKNSWGETYTFNHNMTKVVYNGDYKNPIDFTVKEVDNFKILSVAYKNLNIAVGEVTSSGRIKDIIKVLDSVIITHHNDWGKNLTVEEVYEERRVQYPNISAELGLKKGGEGFKDLYETSHIESRRGSNGVGYRGGREDEDTRVLKNSFIPLRKLYNITNLSKEDLMYVMEGWKERKSNLKLLLLLC